MSIQQEIDKLQIELGVDSPIVSELKNQFEILSQSEVNKLNTTTTTNLDLLPIKEDTEAIRKHLEIRANVSIDYDFIKNDRVKKQLIKDNLRMENVRLNVTKDELTRFYDFCISAFYQIEELLNYYYFLKFQDNSIGLYDFLINNNTNYKIMNSDDEAIKYKKEKKQNDLKEKSLSFITVADKITAFSFGFFDIKTGNYSGATMNSLRLLRNEDLHRCSIIEKNREEKLNKFLFYKNYDAIRDAIKNTAQVIKTNC
jgi:hypothetical protein